MELTMTFKPAVRIVGGLAAAAVLSGCTGRYQSTFAVVVENRVVNAIQVLANGSEIGQVASGQSGSFSLQLPESNANVFSNGVAPTPQAQVTFTAKDMRSGALSAEKTLTLSQASPTIVSFGAADFPTVLPPLASFSLSPTNPGINQDVSFNASGSRVTNGTFRWDFGDGQSGTGVMVTHQFSRAQTFTVTLTVTSDSGLTSTSSRAVTVSASLPPMAANFTFSPTMPAINQDVLFTAAQIPGVENFSWEFGDGALGSGATISHRFSRAATFNVILRVSNSAGQAATTSRGITVSATLPAGSVNFTFSPTNPGITDSVFFNAAATTVANPSFRWDFGDGSSGSGVTTVHQYSRAATFTVTLTVTNDLGQSVSASKTITVSQTSTQLVADFTFSPTDPTITRSTNTVIFDATPSSAGVTAWLWDFGDGSAAATGQRTSHTFSQAGTWVVRLTVADATGRTATTTKAVTVSP
jgi:PKD repeat protein